MQHRLHGAGVQGLLLGPSLAAWFVLLLADTWLILPTFCTTSWSSVGDPAAMDAALRLNSLDAVAAGWMLMVAAMMPPLLATPLTHIRARSVRTRRARSAGLFLIAYAGTWAAAGAALLLLALVLHSLAAVHAAAPGSAATLLALLWQASPLKQRALNRCHKLPPLSPSGAAADGDAFAFGLSHGSACVASCWAMMLIPLALPWYAHVPVMVLVAIFAFAERQEQPRPASWAFRWPVQGLAASLGLAARSGSRLILGK